MSAKYLKSKIDVMATVPGIEGCGVVEIQAGMVWHCAGVFEDLSKIAEATSDYWRLHQRISSNFGKLGELMECIFVHDGYRISTSICSTDMFIFTLTKEESIIDWDGWNVRLKQLKSLIGRME